MSTSGPKDCRFDVSGVGIERLGGEDADARRDRFVGLALERLEKGLKDHLSAVAGNGHADLLANGLLGASEDEVVGEGLQTCTLAIGKRTELLPMIDVSAAATGARDRVGGQYPSVYGLGNNVRIHPDMKVKPFVFLIRLLQDARLEHYLTAEDLAIPVIYGRRNADFEKCVQKILGLRTGRSLRSQIDSVDDLRTSKRCRPNDEEADWRTGLQDALEIGNTARNYLIAAQLAESSTRIKGAIELSEQTVALPEVAGWLAEGDRIEPLDPEHQEAWQQRYGRYDKTRASRTLSAARAVNGLAACVQAAFIQGHAANPFGFDVAAFISSEAKRWGCPEAEISSVIDPLLPSVPSIEDDIVRQASVSGGKEWLLLEKAMTSVMIRLGFDESEHIGQKKAPRDGGYPDIRIKASTMQTCGFADTKATSRYGMDTNDTNKLSLYYKDCWAEFLDRAPSSFFMYIAGGFDGKDAASVLNTLERCTQKYGRPVCAITVNAMLRLVRMNNRPSPEALVRAFSQRAYYPSAESIIRASA